MSHDPRCTCAGGNEAALFKHEPFCRIANPGGRPPPRTDWRPPVTEEIIDGHNKIVIANYGKRVEINTYECSIGDQNKWEWKHTVGMMPAVLPLALKSIGVIHD